ncbi:MAG: extensin family protein [Cypionkella sp.]|nr:extensin family protein [Cypionkella sp.]
MRAGWLSVLAGLTVVSASLALAEAPDTSIRPMPRPGVEPAAAQATETAIVQATAAPSVAAVTLSLRPRPRPDALGQVAAVSAPVMASAAAGAPPPEAAPPAAAPARERRGLFGFLRPAPRPDTPRVEQTASAGRVVPGQPAGVSRSGSVCGIPDIRGETLAPITSRVRGCGIEDPVRVTSVAGIRLSNPATINCDTALAFREWLTRAVEPAYGRGRVVEVHVAASYACRPRNNRKGAKVSEHGRGNAIDVAGFTFSNGRQVKVLNGFDARMRKAHRGACGIFGTTLGPGSDGFHEDHLHFDIARHRNGPYCR